MIYTLDQQLAEIDREISWRKRLYPQWIEKGTLREDRAEQQLGALLAARETLRELRQQKQMTSALTGKTIA